MAKCETLAECKFNPRPRCFHCGKPFANRSRIQVFADAVIVRCPHCGCMTPFKLKRVA
jgi:DNA-directed RNA polymerase subunit RPC12/RpoP